MRCCICKKPTSSTRKDRASTCGPVCALARKKQRDAKFRKENAASLKEYDRVTAVRRWARIKANPAEKEKRKGIERKWRANNRPRWLALKAKYRHSELGRETTKNYLLENAGVIGGKARKYFREVHGPRRRAVIDLAFAYIGEKGMLEELRAMTSDRAERERIAIAFMIEDGHNPEESIRAI